MTMLKIFTGLAKDGTPQFRLEHPFFANAQKQGLTRIPATFKAKSGRIMPCNIIVTLVQKPKTFGAKEQARQAKWRLENGQ